MKTKRILTTIATLLLAVGVSEAQNVSMDFIPFHYPGCNIFQFDNKVLQQHNGDLVANIFCATSENPNGSNYTNLGNIFYKVSPTSFQITDSLFVPYTTHAWYLFSPDPCGEGNLRANIEPDGNGGTALRISHFPDDDLNINPALDIVAPLYDSTASDWIDSYMVDSQGDLILKYYTESAGGSLVCHIARCGSDGTLKHEAVLPESQNRIITMGEFRSSPKQYYQWTTGEDDNLLFYVIDSTFQVKNYYVVNKVLEDVFYYEYLEVLERFWFQSDSHNSTFVFPDGEDLLVAAPYLRDSNFVFSFEECGAAVARYELRTMQRKALVHFNDWPGPSTNTHIMCFQQSSCGDLYLVYREYSQQSPTMTAVKMDRDLNVIWKRYCYEPHELKVEPYWTGYSDVLRDEEGNEKGIYIVGYSNSEIEPYSGIFFFFLTDEDMDTVDEGGLKVRPYAYYPNPVQDRLSLKYSPDVQPQAIELYDLQGRLVHTQTTSLESLSMGGFAVGQYVLKVTMEDGKAFTDKVVKE